MKRILHLIVMVIAAALLTAVNTGCTAKMKKAYHESRADKYYAAGELDHAEIEYLNVLRNDNLNAKAFTRLGLIYFEQGRYQTAAPFLARARSLATNDLEVHLKLGLVLAGAGRAAEAQSEASFILDRNPQDDQAPLLLAQTVSSAADAARVRSRLENLVKSGDRAGYQVALGTLAYRDNDAAGALADFQRALKLDPKSADAYESLGALQAALNDTKSAGDNFKTAADLSPERSTKRMIYARFKLQCGDPGAARLILADVVKQAPDYVPALMGLSEIALATTNFDDCHANLSKVMARDPDNFDGLLLDSRLRYAQGDLGGAVATLERMATIYPQAPRVHFQLGAAYLASGDDTKATVSLNQALQLDPNFVDAVIVLAEIQVKNQNPDPAIVSLGNVVKKYPKILQAQLVLADAYRLRGRVSDALAIYEALEKSNPDNPQMPLMAGSAWLQQGDPARARQKFEQALVIAPQNLPALEQLVNLDLTDKNYAAAMDRLQAKLTVSPDNLTLYLLEAKVQLASGNHADTEKTLLQAEKVAPQSEQPYMLLAQFYVDTKQPDQAAVALQAALSRNPKNLSAMMLLATMAETAKDNKGAADIYEKMLLINPDCSPALNNAAYLYSEYLGQPDRAYDLAQHARALLPYDPAAADTLGWICVKRGSYSTALTLLQQSVAKLPGVPDIQFHYGMANYLTDDEADARSAFNLALATGKDFRGQDECRLCLALMDINPQTADAATIAKLEQRVADKPEDPVAQGRLAAVYQREGKPDKAVTGFEAVLKTDNKNVAAMNALVTLYEPADAAKAYAMAKDAYSLAPNNLTAADAYGRLAYQNKDYKLANTVLQTAVQNQPGDGATQYDYARAAYSVGKVPEAQAALLAAQAAGLAPGQATEARRMADLIAQASTPPASAASQIAGILQTEPDYVPALMVQARLSEQGGDAAAAAAAGEKILAHFPDFAPAQRELAILYSQDATKTSAAYAYAMKARETYPSDPALAKAAAIIVFQQGDFARTIGLLKTAMAVSPNDPEIYYYLGAAQFKLLQNSSSKTSLKQALNLKLSGPLADSARQMLAVMK